MARRRPLPRSWDPWSGTVVRHSVSPELQANCLCEPRWRTSLHLPLRSIARMRSRARTNVCLAYRQLFSLLTERAWY